MPTSAPTSGSRHLRHPARGLVPHALPDPESVGGARGSRCPRAEVGTPINRVPGEHPARGLRRARTAPWCGRVPLRRTRTAASPHAIGTATGAPAMIGPAPDRRAHPVAEPGVTSPWIRPRPAGKRYGTPGRPDRGRGMLGALPPAHRIVGSPLGPGARGRGAQSLIGAHDFNENGRASRRPFASHDALAQPAFTAVVISGTASQEVGDEEQSATWAIGASLSVLITAIVSCCPSCRRGAGWRR